MNVVELSGLLHARSELRVSRQRRHLPVSHAFLRRHAHDVIQLHAVQPQRGHPVSAYVRQARHGDAGVVEPNDGILSAHDSG